MFLKSARELKNIKALVTTAMLLALYVVLSVALSVSINDSLKISVSFVAIIAAASLFGPIPAMIMGGLGDILQYVIRPTGAYFFGFTISAALCGFIFGIVFYKKEPSELNENKDYNDEKKIITVISRIIPLVASVSLFIPNFVTVYDNDQVNNLIETASGSAIGILTGFVKNDPAQENIMAAVMAGTAVVGCFSLIFFQSFSRRWLGLFLSSFLLLILLLTAYTKRESMVPGVGFYVITTCIVAVMVFDFMYMLLLKSMDSHFLLRCFFAMFFVAMAINVFLGTYWISILYGYGYKAILLPRIVKNLIQLPFNTVIAYYVVKYIGRVYRYSDVGSMYHDIKADDIDNTGTGKIKNRKNK